MPSMTALWIIACAALLTMLPGCAWLGGYDAEGRPVAKQFQVDLSNLDWIEISYMPRPGDPVFAVASRLSLMGSGEVVFRTGRSPQVWDSFSSEIDNPHWNELYEDRLHLESTEMQALYQEFVNAGLFPRRSLNSSAAEVQKPFVKVNAKIGHERALRIVDDRRIVRIVERVLEQFEATARLAHEGEAPR